MKLAELCQQLGYKGRYPFNVQGKATTYSEGAWKSAQPDKVFVMSGQHGKLDCVISLLQGNVSSFYQGKVVGVNVDNEENREKEHGWALLIEGNKFFVVGDKGVLRKL